MRLPFLVLAVAVPLWGRECVAVEGERILGGDLARADARFAALPAGEFIAYTPVPGATRVLAPGDLSPVARRYRLDEKGLEVACFQYRVQAVDPGAFRAALEKSFAGARVTLADYSRYDVPAGEIEFARSTAAPDRGDGTRLFRGWVRYAGRRTFSIWARARVEVTRKVVVAAEPLRAGDAIRREQVREMESASAPDDSAQRVEDVAGQALRRDLPSGAVIQPRMLIPVREIARGDAVRVEVRSGAARLALEGKAESAAHRGETVMLVNERSGRRFRATVTGPGRARVDVETLRNK